jgi:glycosyltransferase involved in cell wall biosynthesis
VLTVSHRPLVSILINNYNYGRFLDDAVSSALFQSYDNIEVIVVDDGSTDDSAEVLKKYDGKIKTIFKENGGQASAFNAGFAASSGEIICFLDADDAYSPEKIECIVEVLTEDGLEYCFDAVVHTDAELKPKYPNLKRSKNIYITDFRAQMRSGSLRRSLIIPIPATSGLSFRRSVLERLLPLPESESCSMCENYMKYIAVGTTKGAFMDTTLTLQRIHGSNLFTLHREASMGARISILCGYWIAKNYPELSKFADTQIALGIYLARKASTKIDDRYWNYVLEHMNRRSFWNIIKIRARVLIHNLREALARKRSY